MSRKDSGGLTPTAEQTAIIDACVAGQHLVIEAGAGTGKTSTLKLAARRMPGAGVYVAYNAAIAREAKASFPSSVTCSTAHSLAFRAVGVRYKHRLNGPRMKAQETARILRINEPVRLSDLIVLSSQQLARIAIATVNRYCQSAADTVQSHHVPPVTGVGDAEHAVLQEAIVPLAARAWEDLQAQRGQLAFQHDHYLKMWQLTRPRLSADYVLFDEAQDANPVIAAVVQDQHHAQRIAVGDSCQQLYAWRGAVDALATWNADQRLLLSQSWRFGPAVAEEANKWLGLLRARLRLTGTPTTASTVGGLAAADAVLCRTNAEAVAQAMAAMNAGRKAALVGGGDTIRRLAKAAITLQAGRGTDHPELFVFRTWGEVQDYVQHDDAGADLRVFVTLIDTYGPETVIDAVDRLVGEDQADLVISTAHKAKGREWPVVRIAGDFPEPKPHPDTGERGDVSRTDAMLAYVAVTRARQHLDPGGLSWIDRYLPVDHRTG